MHAHAIGFDRLAFQLFDQLLRIARSFDIEGVMRHAGRALFRGIEQTESSFTGTQAEDFDAGDGLLGGYFRAQRLLGKSVAI